jgi:UDP-2-acetamido-2-deoxy-ribo-hexuluronate aminotransferase
MQFIDLTKQYSLIEKKLKERFDAIMRRASFIMGPEVAELEKRLNEYIGSKYCITCSSGTDALVMALMAQGVGKGDAIFTTPFTFFATAEVIALTGATPVFVDSDPKTCSIDPAALNQAIAHLVSGKAPSKGTVAGLKPRGIITVDLYGVPAEYDQINAIAEKNRLFVIEDACQSFGGMYKGKKCCNLTQMGATSFFPSKPLGCYGDGGAVFTDDSKLAEMLRSLRIHGMGADQYDNVRIGINGRLDTLQAAVLLSKMELFDEELKKRKVVAQRYIDGLKDIAGFPQVPAGCSPSWAYFTILIDNRDAIRDQLKKSGVPVMIYYPKPLHLQKAFTHLQYEQGSMPNAESTACRVLSLPMHPYLEEQEQDQIIHFVRIALKS